MQTIPWSKMNISVLGIESNYIGNVFPGSLHELREYMLEQGYVIYQKVAIDEIYIKKSLLKR